VTHKRAPERFRPQPTSVGLDWPLIDGNHGVAEVDRAADVPAVLAIQVGPLIEW